MKVLVLTGPTCAGKTEVAAELARRLELELVSADSRQVYTWLDIGTAKPSRELRQEVRFHMVDLVDPGRTYSAADYARDATAVMRRLVREGKRFIVVGGSGLYIRAVFNPFFEVPRPSQEVRARFASRTSVDLYAELARVDPDRAKALHPNDRQRVVRALEVYALTGRTMTELTRTGPNGTEFAPVYAVLTAPRPLLHSRIDKRLDRMVEAGLLDEVRQLREAGFGKGTYVANAYGYAELLAHLDGEMALDAAIRQAKAKTKAYARRQLTWCRSLEDARWFECGSTEAALGKLLPLAQAVVGARRLKSGPVSL